MSNSKRVLVLLSTYNGECYLEEQLDSILNQEQVSPTILIRDDGSVDSTKTIINKYIEKYPHRIIFEEGNNVGFAQSFSELLRIAYESYDGFLYYAFADQDDVWEPKKLLAAVQQLEELSADMPVAYCSNTTLVDKDLNFIGYAWKDAEVCITKPRALIQNFATGCTMVFNRKAVELYVSHRPPVIKRHDFLMFQICVFLGKVVYDKHSYINYRQHGNNQIGRPGFCQRWKRRWTTQNYKKRTLETQNYRFLKAYKDLLDVDDIGLISQIAFYRKKLWTKLSLIFDYKIKYTNVKDNFFYLLKLIIGGG